MKKQYYILLMSILMITINSSAQPQQTDSITMPLNIKDKVPNKPIGLFVDGSRGKKILDYKKRLIILDFMTSSCTSCLASIPKLENLQKKYGYIVKIFPVAYESKAIMGKTLSSVGALKNNTLDYVVEDSTWKRYFPHQTVPHTVWILDGQVKAITIGEYIKEETIQKMLDDVQLDLPVKNDFLEFDYSKPIALSYPDSIKSMNVLMGYLPEADTKFGESLDSATGQLRSYMINANILPMYFHILSNSRLLPLMKKERIELLVKNKSRLEYDPALDLFEEDWRIRNAYSYERIFHAANSKEERSAMVLADLDQFFHLKTSMKKRKRMVWTISEAGGQEPDDANTPVSDFVFFADLNRDLPPILNVTKKGRKMTGGIWNTFEELQALLKKSNLKVEKDLSLIDVFVVEDAD